MRITIKDIANAAGVTQAAVSKALNDKHDISPELKVKIKRLAEEMGYYPDLGAKRLAKRASNTVGLFLLTRYKVSLEENYGYRFFGGIMEEAHKNGMDIVLFSNDSIVNKNDSYMRLCRERNVEGAIFIGLGESDPQIEELKSSKMPIVFIDVSKEGEKLASVSSDNVKGVRAALGYLYQLGHRDIGIVNGHSEAWVSRLRFDAFCGYAEEKNINYQEYVYNGDFTSESGYTIGKKIAVSENRPSAIFSANDMMAFGLIRALREFNIKVPEDISIIGYDNWAVNEFIEPRLTTIAQNPTLMGKMAVELLIKMIKEPESKPEHKLLEPEIILRSSCARK